MYAAACGVATAGIDVEWTCAEVYAIDAATRAEAEAIDASTAPEPADIRAIYEECRVFKTPGTGQQLWLLPERHAPSRHEAP
jgi:hypothetical protein